MRLLSGCQLDSQLWRWRPFIEQCDFTMQVVWGGTTVAIMDMWILIGDEVYSTPLETCDVVLHTELGRRNEVGVAWWLDSLQATTIRV